MKARAALPITSCVWRDFASFSRFFHFYRQYELYTSQWSKHLRGSESEESKSGFS
jgi:hypothetical protein